MTVNLTSALIYGNVMNADKPHLSISKIQKKFCILINISLTEIELVVNILKVKFSIKYSFIFGI